MYFESYIHTVNTLYKSYDGAVPLAIFLKNYFKENKKFGSRDRKIIADLIYGIYRLGIQDKLLFAEKVTIGAFLSGRVDISFFEKNELFYTQSYTSTLHEKLTLIHQKFALEYHQFDAISKGLQPEKFTLNMFSVPKLFLRIRKNKKQCLQILEKNNIDYTLHLNTVSVPLQTKIDTLLQPSDYVVQDRSSQEIGNYFNIQDNNTWWDCCAASGGKSILLWDLNNKIQLTVSDVRKSSLINLATRFKLYRINNYKSLVLDCTQKEELQKLPFENADKIICDVPCSGSGTWARTPEQYYFFSKEKLAKLNELQFAITHNAISKLRKGGTLYYITCSIFQSENEQIVEKLLLENPTLKCIHLQLINMFGYGGDAMFIAVLEKN